MFTALAPNQTWDDVMLALKVLISPWRWFGGSERQQLKNSAKSLLNSKHVIFFDSGRTALFSILQSLALQPGDEVLTQAFTCVAVPNSIIWAGGTPVYVDCKLENFTMSVKDLSEKITPRSKVLIIQHTFGHVADVEKLVRVAREHNLYVIEDCAHSLGSMIDGQNAGTFGDASFFSFGRDKAISSVFGGMISTNDSNLADNLESIEKQFPNASFFWVFQQLVYIPIMHIVRETYDFGVGKSLLSLVKKLKIISKPVYKEEHTGLKPKFVFHKFSNALAILALHQFSKLGHTVQHRRKISEIYEKAFDDSAFIKPKTSKEESLLRYTVSHIRAHYILRLMAKKGIYLGNWYTSVLAPQDVDLDLAKYLKGSCPNAEKLSQSTLNLPTDVHITDRDAANLVTLLKSCL